MFKSVFHLNQNILPAARLGSQLTFEKRIYNEEKLKMSGSDTEDSDFASIFGGDVTQASRIPEDLRPILLERWNKIRHELDASRPSVAPDDSGEKATSDPSMAI